MKTNTAASPAPALSQRAALARLASVTAPRPSPAPFCFVACRFDANGAAPARELPARFSFDAKNESAAREIVGAILALGYEVKCALFTDAARSFVPLILSAPETEDAAAKHPENTVRRVMGHAAPLYTEQSAAA